MNRRKAAVLDLRPEADFKAGHLPGAKHISVEQISAGIDKLKLDRKNPIILVCQSGMSARKVVPELKKQGFLEVAVLDGGVQGWQAAALPLVK
jgi:rhodanese-related sulfurtransferase